MAEDLTYVRTALFFGAAKGAIVATAVSLLDITFWKQLVIAIVSGSLGMAGAIIAAYVAVREVRRNRDLIGGKVDEVLEKQKAANGE